MATLIKGKTMNLTRRGMAASAAGNNEQGYIIITRPKADDRIDLYASALSIIAR